MQECFSCRLCLSVITDVHNLFSPCTGRNVGLLSLNSVDHYDNVHINQEAQIDVNWYLTFAFP